MGEPVHPVHRGTRSCGLAVSLSEETTEQNFPPGSGSSAQIIIDSFVGAMVISADRLAPYVESLVRDAISAQGSGASAEHLAGALLETHGSDERFSGSLIVSTQPSYATAWTVWVSQPFPDRWSVAVGPNPDHLSGLRLSPAEQADEEP